MCKTRFGTTYREAGRDTLTDVQSKYVISQNYDVFFLYLRTEKVTVFNFFEGCAERIAPIGTLSQNGFERERSP